VIAGTPPLELIGALLPDAWPQADPLDVLPLQGAASGADGLFGVRMVLEQETNTVVGDIGFFGPPRTDGALEVGYSIISARRRRGYATAAASALISWALTFTIARSSGGIRPTSRSARKARNSTPCTRRVRLPCR